MGNKKSQEPSFAELETSLRLNIDKLESEELPLEEALLIYEEATKLLKSAQTRLDAAEQRVTILRDDADMKLTDADN